MSGQIIPVAMTGAQLARAIGLPEAARLLKGWKGKPPTVDTVRDYIRFGYRPRGHDGEPAYLRAAMHGGCYVTLAEWCAEFQDEKAALGEALLAARRRAAPRAPARKAAAMHRRAEAALDRAGVA